MEGGSPTIRRRRLGKALRGLRERAGLTGNEAGLAVERSGSWISRLEGGRVGLRGPELRELLDLYDVHDPRRRDELEALAREGRRRGWWSRYAEDLPEMLVLYLGLEEEARVIHNFQDSVIPGLLQTERYCRAIVQQSVAAFGPMQPSGIDARVQVRMARQEHMKKDPRELNFLVDEAVLYRTIGGTDVLREQLEHLASASQAPHINLRAIPFAHGDRTITANGFVVMGFPQDPDVVLIETSIGLTYIDRDEEVGTYHRIFRHLTEAALNPEETRMLIIQAKERLS